MTRFSRRILSRAQCVSWALRVSVLLPLAVTLAQTPAASQVPAPAQLPLRNLAQPPVKPNLMVMLDDSSSMGLLYMPEQKIIIDGWTINSPAFANSIGFDPADRLPGNVLGGSGTFTADPASTAWQQRAMRSSDTNSVYYNPKIRYQPWLKSDGSRYPPANIRRAVLDLSLPETAMVEAPVSPGSPTKAMFANIVDLSQTISSKTALWCSDLSGGAVVGCSESALTYAPGLYYRLQRAPSGTVFLDPQQTSSYLAFDANAPEGLPRGAGRSDCAASQCTQAEEQQNFANWFVYYRSRLHLAKAVIGETLGRLGNQVRLGFGSLSSPTIQIDGLGSFPTIRSGVRDFDAARRAEVLNWVYGLRYAGGTPLIRAIYNVGTYYEVSDSRGPWGATPGTASSEKQASCRAAYHLMITDGLWSGSTPRDIGNIDGIDGPVITLANGKTWQYIAKPPYKDSISNFLSDFAMYFWNRDLQPDLPNNVPLRPGNEASWQSMTNFFVGLGVRGTFDSAKDLPALTRGELVWGADKIDDLWHAALNSRGAYFSAFDTETLGKSLRDAFASITRQDQSQAGVVAATADAGAGNRRYATVFRAGDWSGDLLAYPLGGSSPSVTPAWSAERALPAWDQRRIFIWDDGLAQPAAVSFVPGELSTSLGSAITPQDLPALVNYLRGDRSREGDGSTRIRGGLLGDFINSTPVVAGDAADPDAEAMPDTDKSYAAYLAGVKKTRARVVYAGSNGGMLHAFRDAPGANESPEGREIFAYIPRAVADDLKRLRDPEYAVSPERHRYFVDGPLRLADVKVSPPQASGVGWRNYLLGSTGAGPAAVFALDVTDPSSLGPLTPRWEIRNATQPKLGHVLAPIATGQLPNGKWVAMFGNGYGSTAGSPVPQAHLFVVEVETGVVRTLALPKTTEANGLGGVALRRNGQGQIVGAYAGDLTGRLWRFDYDEQDAAFFRVGLGGEPLFKAATGQAIMQAPWVQLSGQTVRLAFGTGRLITDQDANGKTVQAVYVVEDRDKETLTYPLGPDQLEARELSLLTLADAKAGSTFFQVSTPTIDWAQRRGWRLPLTGEGVPAGLRVLQPLQPLVKGNDLLLIAAESPAVAGDPCDLAQGKGVNLLLKASGGPAPTRPILDTTGDGVVNSSDSALAAGYQTVADGADAVLLPQSSSGTNSGGTSGTGSTTGGSATKCAKQLQILGSNESMAVCASGSGALKARVWRRILQPPF